LADPTKEGVVATGDVLLPQVWSLRSAKLRLATAPRRARHAAEEIDYHDVDVEIGDVMVEIPGGTDADLDAIYVLANARRERQIIVRAAEEQPLRFLHVAVATVDVPRGLKITHVAGGEVGDPVGLG
jgi:hypothetical protein